MVLAAAVLGGCSPQPTPGRVEDTLTSGRILVVCASEARDLLRRERDAFEALYPEAKIELRDGASRDAVGALFSGEGDLAAITRELEPEERTAAERGGLGLTGYRVARDAVVAIVNGGNRVENVAVEDLRGVYRGEIARWSSLGGTERPIRVVVQPPGSDITRYFVQEVMGGEPLGARSLHETSDSAVVARVRLDPDAIGYVSVASAGPQVRALRVSPLTGLPYWKPDPEAVYRGDYPLTRFVSFYVRSPGSRLANGFITFVTSRDGQQIVHESGLVPTTVPVRFVRRSPMLGTH